MGLIREPEGVDFIIKSEPWTESELAEFSALLKKLKAKRQAKARRLAAKQTA